MKYPIFFNTGSLAESLPDRHSNKMKIEICKLCGQTKELTFEHVPPRLAFNKKTRYRIIPHLDFLKSENPLSFSVSGKIEQGGIGFYSLCASCNNFLGTNYVTAFGGFVRSVAGIIKNKQFNFFGFTIHKLETLKVLKQICSMFLSINDIPFYNNNPDLVEFVKSASTKQLPDRYRLFIYLNTEGRFRHLPLFAKGNIKDRITIIASEITFPPLGYVLLLDFKGQVEGLTEITHFKNSDMCDVDLDLYLLPTHLPIPLDYRSKEQIEIDILNNQH